MCIPMRPFTLGFANGSSIQFISFSSADALWTSLMSRRCNKTDCDVAGGPWNGAEMPRRFTVHEHSLYRCVCVCVCVCVDCGVNKRWCDRRVQRKRSTTWDKTSCCTADSERPHRCCHPPNSVEFIDRVRTHAAALRITTGWAKHWGHRLMTIILWNLNRFLNRWLFGKSCKHERDCLVHVLRLLAVCWPGAKSAWHNHALARNFNIYSPISKKNHHSRTQQ